MDNGGMSQIDSDWLRDSANDKSHEFKDKKISMLINQVEEYKKIVDKLKTDARVKKEKIDAVIEKINNLIPEYHYDGDLKEVIEMLENLKNG